LERELVIVIARLSDLSAELSVIGVGLDRTAEQMGFADVELTGIENQIEIQAVDAYMTVLSSPTASLINSESVEKALVASIVVEDVVASGRQSVDQLVVKRRRLEELQASFLASQDEFAAAQAEVNAEAERLMALYEQADQVVAAAVREAEAADAAYRAALSAIDLAKARQAESRRQDDRVTSSEAPEGTDTTTAPTTAPPVTTPPTTSVTTATTAPSTTTTTTGGGGGYSHPPEAEQWRSLVQQHFPSNRVEEALRILDCESNGDPNAYNPYSGASGLFQFLPSTWATTSPKAGWSGHSVFHPEANVASAAWLANRYQELGQYYWQAWSCRRVLG
jgi:hypothetical protein